MADENDFDHLSLLSVESVGDKLSAGLDFDRKRHLLASMSTLSSVSSVTLLGAGCGSYVAEDSVSCASMPGEAFPQVYPHPLSFLFTFFGVYLRGFFFWGGAGLEFFLFADNNTLLARWGVAKWIERPLLMLEIRGSNPGHSASKNTTSLPRSLKAPRGAERTPGSLN